MDFFLSDEQQQLQDAVQRFARGRYGFEFRKTVLASAEGLDRGIWAGLAELGLLGLRVPEAQGGLGLSAVEVALAQQALAPALLVEPYTEVAVTAASVLADLGDTTLLPQLAAGECIAVLAHQEAAGRGDPAFVRTHALAEGDDIRLDGHKAVVAGAAVADEWLVSAREPGGAVGSVSPRVSLFRVPRGTAGVALRPCVTIDGRRAAELRFDGVRVPASARVGAVGGALPAIEHALDRTLAALCAEGVGLMQATVDSTVEYLKTRVQFGQPIGRFQALQHRAVEMLVHLEQARSMMWLAALRCDEPDAAARQRPLAAAKVVLGQAARFVREQAMQLHGGIGMTDELVFSHGFKRLLAIELACGGTDFQLRRFIQAGAAEGAGARAA